MHQRPLLLVTNDDGVFAPGLEALKTACARFAEVVVVAPERNQSANSHSVTLHRPLRHRVLSPGVHALDGTPADCVYVALHHAEVLGRRPDAVVSGINHGANLGQDVYYSGTVAAAREGTLRGLPSIAFSQCGGNVGAEAAAWAGRLVERLLEHLVERQVTSPDVAASPPLINVNFPERAAFSGVSATVLGLRRYGDQVTTRQDPRGHDYLWLGGPALATGAGIDDAPDTDTAAVAQGLVSVTALCLNPTSESHRALATHLAAPHP